jgi:hypothetical protein
MFVVNESWQPLPQKQIAQENWDGNGTVVEAKVTRSPEISNERGLEAVDRTD